MTSMSRTQTELLCIQLHSCALQSILVLQSSVIPVHVFTIYVHLEVIPPVYDLGRGRRSWRVRDLDPCQYTGRVTVAPLHKNVTFVHSKPLLDNSASFTSSRMKDLCQKWKVKLNFRGAYRLLRNRIVGCWEITDVEYNLKQFDGLT